MGWQRHPACMAEPKCSTKVCAQHRHQHVGIPIGPPKGIEAKDLYRVLSMFIDLGLTLPNIILFYMEILSELIVIVEILEDDPF